jgi:hypothetical protein
MQDKPRSTLAGKNSIETTSKTKKERQAGAVPMGCLDGGGARDSTRAWAWCCVASLDAVTIRGCGRHDVRFIVLGGKARDQWVVLGGGCDVRHREGCGAQARALFTALAAASALYVLPRHPKDRQKDRHFVRRVAACGVGGWVGLQWVRIYAPTQASCS